MPMIAAVPAINTLSLETDPQCPPSRWLELPVSLSDIVHPSPTATFSYPRCSESQAAVVTTRLTLVAYLTGARIRNASKDRTARQFPTAKRPHKSRKDP